VHIRLNLVEIAKGLFVLSGEHSVQSLVVAYKQLVGGIGHVPENAVVSATEWGPEQKERRALTCENAVVSATEWGPEQKERRALTCENAVVSATEWGPEQK
jgi:hypothetical protein